MEEKTLVIMAAGLGSRFGGLKQLEPVGPNGEFIIDYSIYDALRAGFNHVVFVIKKELEEAFRDTIGKRIEEKIKVDYAYQEISNIPSKQYLVEKREKPWGTAHAVYSAKPYVKGNFAIINADDFYGRDAFMKASMFYKDFPEGNIYASINYPYLSTSSLYGSVKRGICYLEDDNILKIIESKITTKDGYALAEPLNGKEAFKISLDQPVSMNFFVCKANFFTYLDDYIKRYLEQDDEVILNSEMLLPDPIKEGILSNKIVLKNFVTSGQWLGMTYHEELEQVKQNILELIKKGEYPRRLWEK